MITSQRKYPCIDKVGMRRNLPQGQVRNLANMQKLKAAFKVSAIWPTGSIIRISFMDGSSKQRNWVQKVVTDVLAPLCSALTFQWNVPLSQSDIRISFSLMGQAWSYVGTECLTIPRSEITMNLGWIDDDQQYDSEPFKNTGQVVIHEFCHALGMIHEHQNPKNNQIVWNKPVVYAELKRTNGWDKKQVDVNIFQKYGDKDVCEIAKAREPYEGRDVDIEGYCRGDQINGSEYDIHSIMHYWYPPSWVLAGSIDLPVNTKLSSLDKEWIAKYYGGGSSSTSNSAPGVTPECPSCPEPQACPSCPSCPEPQACPSCPDQPKCLERKTSIWKFLLFVFIIFILVIAIGAWASLG